MKHKTGLSLGIAGLILTSLFLSRCRGTEMELPGEVSLPSEHPFGGFTLDCKDQPPQHQQQQQQQVQFSPERQEGCVPEFQFQQERLSDFIVLLDCDAKLVIIRSSSGEAELPIDSDGRVYGQMKFKNPVKNDSRGSGACWVDYFVTFTGTAECDEGRGDRDRRQDKVNLTTHVEFAPTNPREIPDSIESAEVISPMAPAPEASDLPVLEPELDPSPSPSPNPSPSISPSPTPSESPGQRPDPRPTRTVRPSPSPRPTNTAVVTPVITCVVEKPCPLVSKTELSCPPQQR